MRFLPLDFFNATVLNSNALKAHAFYRFVFTPVAERELSSNGSGRHYRTHPISYSDLVDVGERVKHIAIVPLVGFLSTRSLPLHNALRLSLF